MHESDTIIFPLTPIKQTKNPHNYMGFIIVLFILKTYLYSNYLFFLHFCNSWRGPHTNVTTHIINATQILTIASSVQQLCSDVSLYMSMQNTCIVWYMYMNLVKTCFVVSMYTYFRHVLDLFCMKSILSCHLWIDSFKDVLFRYCFFFLFRSTLIDHIVSF